MGKNLDKTYPLSIVTPTFQRLDCLRRLYSSLLAQTCHDFEWIVVDDGSTDGTSDWVNSIVSTSPFDVVLIRKKNGGKHSALNRAFPAVRGHYLAVADSDDTLLPEAVSEILCLVDITEDLHRNARKKGHNPICGFATPTLFPDKNRITVNTPPDVTLTDFISLRSRLKVGGDTFDVLKTKYIRHFRFPEFEGESFVGESYLLDSLALHYDIVYFDTPLLVRSYGDDGLSANFVRLLMDSPESTSLVFALHARHPRQTPKIRAITQIRYWAYTLGSRLPWKDRINAIGVSAIHMLIPALALKLYYTLFPHSKPIL